MRPGRGLLVSGSVVLVLSALAFGAAVWVLVSSVRDGVEAIADSPAGHLRDLRRRLLRGRDRLPGVVTFLVGAGLLIGGAVVSTRWPGSRAVA